MFLDLLPVTAKVNRLYSIDEDQNNVVHLFKTKPELNISELAHLASFISPKLFSVEVRNVPSLTGAALQWREFVRPGENLRHSLFK